MKDKHDRQTIDMLKEPPKTGAERQRAYRERLKRQHTAVRLDLMLDSVVMAQLEGIMQVMGGEKGGAKPPDFSRVYPNCEPTRFQG